MYKHIFQIFGCLHILSLRDILGSQLEKEQGVGHNFWGCTISIQSNACPYLCTDNQCAWITDQVCCENQKLLHPSVSCSTERPADTADIREMQDKARGIGNLSAEVQRRFASGYRYSDIFSVPVKIKWSFHCSLVYLSTVVYKNLRQITKRQCLCLVHVCQH